MPAGLPLVHLHSTSVVEVGGMSNAPTSVRDRPSRAREGKLGWKVYLPPHLEQGGMPLMEGSRCWSPLFSLLQMQGTQSSRLTPLNCVLKNWDKFDPQSLKKTCLTFFCKSAWPQYPLESSRQGPVEGSLSYDTVLQLDRFCRRQWKW